MRADAVVCNSAGFSPPPAAVRRLPQVIASAQVAYPQALISAGGRDLPSSWGLAGSTGNVLGRSPSFERETGTPSWREN
jgi:hypothetical protein